MVVNRTVFFLGLFGIFMMAFVANKCWWLLHAKRTTGVFGFQGAGNALDQIRTTSYYASFRLNNKTIYFSEKGHLSLKPGTLVPVVYQPGNPTDAKVYTVGGFWRGTLVYGLVLLLLLGAVFVQPAIVPWKARLRLHYKRPFIQLI